MTTHCYSAVALIAAALIISGCAAKRPPTPVPAPEPGIQASPPGPRYVDPMADVPGDRPLSAAKGISERYDCMAGVEDEHARIAFEALGGQVTGFSYYSKWKPRTCSIDMQYTDKSLKWRLTPDAAIRVHSPYGVFLVRTTPDTYVFEFQNVQRVKYCGITGTINGTMTVRRFTPEPECSVTGVMNR